MLVPVRTFVSMSLSGFAPDSTDAQRGSCGVTKLPAAAAPAATARLAFSDVAVAARFFEFGTLPAAIISFWYFSPVRSLTQSTARS